MPKFVQKNAKTYISIWCGLTIGKFHLLSPFSHFLKDLFAADISGMI
jgi:hypothetical protein